MNVHQIIFSPTGGTRRVSDILCKNLGLQSVLTDLCVKADGLEHTEINSNEPVIIAMPVFAGRVPALAVERLRKVKSNGAKCVLVAVYGNRAYDDALLEMYDVASELGYKIVAAIGAIAEHSIARIYGSGRPDIEDEKELSEFAEAIKEKLDMGSDCTTLNIPGNQPYRQGNTGPYPEANESCTECGLCARQCPADAITIENIRTVDKEKCIGCMRCVSLCPQQARSIGAALNVISERLKPVCSVRRNNELFI